MRTICLLEKNCLKKMDLWDGMLPRNMLRFSFLKKSDLLLSFKIQPKTSLYYILVTHELLGQNSVPSLKKDSKMDELIYYYLSHISFSFQPRKTIKYLRKTHATITICKFNVFFPILKQKLMVNLCLTSFLFLNDNGALIRKGIVPIQRNKNSWTSFLAHPNDFAELAPSLFL